MVVLNWLRANHAHTHTRTHKQVSYPCFIFCSFPTDTYQSLVITFLHGKKYHLWKLSDLIFFLIGNILHPLWKYWLTWQLKKPMTRKPSSTFMTEYLLRKLAFVAFIYLLARTVPCSFCGCFGVHGLFCCSIRCSWQSVPAESQPGEQNSRNSQALHKISVFSNYWFFRVRIWGTDLQREIKGMEVWGVGDCERGSCKESVSLQSGHLSGKKDIWSVCILQYSAQK